MPTYDYRCPKCSNEASIVQTMREYATAPKIPHCTCQSIFVNREGRKLVSQCVYTPMERKLSVVPGRAIYNALAGDRHYDGLKATDGTDISTRAKHRAYMKANNLTTIDDFKDTWAQKQAEREAFRRGETKDPEIRQIVTEQVMQVVAKTE